MAAAMVQIRAKNFFSHREVAVRKQASRTDDLGGSRCSIETCSRATTAPFACPVLRYKRSSMVQLCVSAGLRFTARKKASIARGASPRIM